MTEYGIRRERRRRSSAVALVLVMLVIFAGLSFRIGPLLAALAAVALPVLTFAAVEVWTRRIAGDGWAASLPAVFARRLGLPGSGRHGREDLRNDRWEFLGRLVLDGDVLRWEPRAADRRRGMRPVEWRRPWDGELVRLPGPGRAHCLTLVGPDGEPLDLWIRDPRRTAWRIVPPNGV